MPLGAARFGLLGGVADLGKLELISTQTASGISAVEFTTSTGTLDLSYNVHFLTYNNLSVTAYAEPIRCQLYENGVLETASVYQFAYQYCYNTGTFLEAKTTTSSGIYITNDMGNGSTDSTNGYRYFYNLGDSSKYSFVTGNGISSLYTPVGTYIMGFGANVLPQASVVDGIKFFCFVGTFSGTFSLYGIRYS